MLRIVARVLGIVVAVLAIAGLFMEGHLFGLMNVDIAIDLLRVILAAALLYVGFADTSAGTLRAVVIVVGALYVVMGLLAFADRTLFGLLPSGLTDFDIGFHLVVGVGALALVFLPVSRGSEATTDGTARAR